MLLNWTLVDTFNYLVLDEILPGCFNIFFFPSSLYNKGRQPFIKILLGLMNPYYLSFNMISKSYIILHCSYILLNQEFTFHC